MTRYFIRNPRKIIQLSHAATDSDGSYDTFAVCDDGTTWYYSYVSLKWESHWPAIPQEETT